MSNVEEQGAKTIEFSPIGNGNEITGNTPETIKNDSQTKRTSFTQKFASMVRIKPKDKKDAITATDKGKNFGMVSAITTETGQCKEQETAGNPVKHIVDSKAPLVELGDLMLKLEQMDKKLKCSEEDRLEMRKELRHNKNEDLDNYFTLARATEEKLQQMTERVETTDKEREKNIRKDKDEMRRGYVTVNENLWNLETRMDTMSGDQAESSCAIQFKLDGLLRNSITQVKTASENLEKQPGTKVDFVEPQCKKQELPQLYNSIGSGTTKMARKVGVSNSTRIPRDSSAHTSITPDPMTWANI